MKFFDLLDATSSVIGFKNEFEKEGIKEVDVNIQLSYDSLSRFNNSIELFSSVSILNFF